MTAISVAKRPNSLAEQRSTRIVFFVTGFGSSTWAALIPFAKARAHISDGGLGLLLLCLGIGSIIMMPAAGACVAKFGCRLVIIITALVVIATLPLLAVFSTLPVLMVTLMAFGAGIGALDVAMNIQAILVERASGRAMMSGFHGLYSIGGIAGSGGMTALFISRASPLLAALCISVVILALLSRAAPYLLPNASKSNGPSFAIPRGIVLLIGMQCFVLFLAEGAVLDWSAVFLTSVRQVATSYAGLGYAVFATMMAAGRLEGDRIVDHVGRKRIVLIGGMFAAFGFVLTITVPSPLVTLLGYALVGVGCANIVPVLFNAVGRQSIMPENLAVSAISTIGYAGILAGPAGIGLIASFTSLPVAFLVVAAMLLAVSLSSCIL